jgi:hypothetical protein
LESASRWGETASAMGWYGINRGVSVTTIVNATSTMKTFLAKRDLFTEIVSDLSPVTLFPL